MSKLRDILAELYRWRYEDLGPCCQKEIDAACEKVHEVGLSSCGYSGPVLSREWWDDFCSIAKERQEIAGHETRLQCTHCNKGYSTYDKSYRFCPVCGTSLVPQPELKRESETVDGILADCQDEIRRNHGTFEKDAIHCSRCIDERRSTAKRLSDALLEALRNGHACGTCACFTTIERIVRKTFGQEGR